MTSIYALSSYLEEDFFNNSKLTKGMLCGCKENEKVVKIVSCESDTMATAHTKRVSSVNLYYKKDLFPLPVEIEVGTNFSKSSCRAINIINEYGSIRYYQGGIWSNPNIDLNYERYKERDVFEEARKDCVNNQTIQSLIKKGLLVQTKDEFDEKTKIYYSVCEFPKPM